MMTVITWSMTQRGKPLLIDEENYDPGRSARRKAKQEHIKSILDQFVEDKDPWTHSSPPFCTRSNHIHIHIQVLIF